MANQIVQVPGIGQDVQQSLAPLIQVLQQRNAWMIQQHEQEQQLAAQIFAHGMQTPGFETSDAARQLELKMGVPGLGKSIATARVTERKRRLGDIEAYVAQQPGLDPGGRAGLQAALAANEMGATSEMQNMIFSSFASGQTLAALERARLDHLDAETRKLNLDINATPTSEDQRKAAQIIGVPQDQVIAGPDGTIRFPYVAVLADIMKSRDNDATQNNPERMIINATTSMMTNLKNQFGGPALTPAQALDVVLPWFKPKFPEAVARFEQSPEHTAELNAAHDAAIAWRNAADANYEQKDANGKVTKRWKDRNSYREALMASLKAKYGLVTDNNLRTLMDIVERNVFTPRIFGAPEPR